MSIKNMNSALSVNGVESYPLTRMSQVIKDVDTDGRLSEDNLINTYVHKDGTLTGSGTNGKFKATTTATYTAFAIGGVSYAVKAGSETEIELTSGVWYSFIIDTNAKTINFKAGGGLSNSKLAAATATEADVLKGETFYSGNKELKTGTYVPSGSKYSTGGGIWTAWSTSGGSKSASVTVPAGNYLIFVSASNAQQNNGSSTTSLTHNSSKLTTLVATGRNCVSWSTAGDGNVCQTYGVYAVYSSNSTSSHTVTFTCTASSTLMSMIINIELIQII